MEIICPTPSFFKFLATPLSSLVVDEENLVIGFGPPPHFRNASAIAGLRPWLLDIEFSSRSEGDTLSSDALASEFADFLDNKIKAIYGNMQSHHSPNFDDTCNKSGYNCSLLSKQALQEFHPLASLILQTIIENMPSKSCYLDPYLTNLLKERIDELLPAILHIANLSLLNGNFPDELKVACATPHIKEGFTSQR